MNHVYINTYNFLFLKKLTACLFNLGFTGDDSVYTKSYMFIYIFVLLEGLHNGVIMI